MAALPVVGGRRTALCYGSLVVSANLVDPETYRDVLVTARRFTRSEADARDLTQDVLEVALKQSGADWSSPERRAWLRGVVRKRAAFLARSGARRERRELLAGAPSDEVVGAWRWEPQFLASLPRSLRSLAALASADLGAAEIRWLLALTDTALRQRLSALRRALRAHSEPPILPAPAPPPFGASRAEVLALLRKRSGRVIATRDPDGHVIFLRMDAHKTAPSGNRELRETPACPRPTRSRELPSFSR